MPEYPGIHQTALAVATGGNNSQTISASEGPTQGPIIAGLPTQVPPLIPLQKIHAVINWTNAATGTGFTVMCKRANTVIQVGPTLTHNVPAGVASYQAAFEFIDTNVPPGTQYVLTIAALTVAGTAADIVVTCNDFT